MRYKIAVETQNPPKWFGLIGYSWLIMGGLSLLFSLLSFPALGRLDEYRDLFTQALAGRSPEDFPFVNVLLTWAAPVTIAQLIMAGWTTAASYFFLKRKNWARLHLSTINVLTGLTVIVTFQFLYGFIFDFYQKANVDALVASGAIVNLPLWTNVFIGVSLVLVLVPLIWMGFYFHSRSVKAFFMKDEKA